MRDGTIQQLVCASHVSAPRERRVLNLFTVMLAVSTMLPNPLSTLAQLHARPLELPSWVDNTHLRYSLIVHPKNSPLSDDEFVGFLF
jgi:hypothetical protein